MEKDLQACSECGNLVNRSEIITVDGRPICAACFYGGGEPVTIYPIGTVRTELKIEENEFRAKGRPSKNSCIDLLPTQKRFMYKLDEERFLTIVYYLHKSKSIHSVFPRRSNGKRVGVFASRSPHRPSKIAVQDVELLGIRGTTLYVSGLDAIDGSPVLDIKVAMKERHCISKKER
ncbi:MAG: TrmO family methyltransferase domain-containing protein [Thermodesulfobacteriota bacterium]